MTVLCLLAEEFTKENERELECYDSPETKIELFDHAVSGGITLGKTLAIIDELRLTSGEKISFYTDMEALHKYVSAFFRNVFAEIIPAEKTSDIEWGGVEYENLLSDRAACSRLGDIFAKIRTLKSDIRNYHAGIDKAGINANYPVAVEEKYNPIQEEINQDSPAVQAAYYRFLEEYAEVFHEEEREFRFFIFTVLLTEKKDGTFAEKICREALAGGYSVNVLFFLYQQLSRFYFENSGVRYTPYIGELYDTVFEVWKQANAELLQRIPKEERNKNKIVVIARHFIGVQHAPTKSALERIQVLARDMNKQVICFHSREFLSHVGMIPYYRSGMANENEGLNGLHSMDMGDHQFVLYQPPCRMPDFEEMQKIIRTIRTEKPYEIIVIGDHCLLGDLCAEMIPTICIPVVFSVTVKKNQFIATGRRLTDADYRAIEQAGGKKEQYIETLYTYQPIAQKGKLTRAQLGLPEDRFLLAVIGSRLDSEVTEEFLDALEALFADGIHIAFAGTFDRYAEYCNKRPVLKEHSTHVGYQSDLPAFEELCDLYVNPKRSGGGISAVEAFRKHIPGVSLRYGDVAIVMGEEFCVGDFGEMIEKIRCYKAHPDYYETMAQKAYQRSLELSDGKAEMQYILEEAEKREGFF